MVTSKVDDSAGVDQMPLAVTAEYTQEPNRLSAQHPKEFANGKTKS
jgi:hypothetical protein